MKVGIMTITNDKPNYGNRLQNYAVQKVLESIGCEAETINNINKRVITKPYKVFIKNIISSVYYNMSSFEKNKLNTFLREKRFHDFDKKYVKKSKYSVTETNIPKDLPDFYDYFVCGSDQVWNPSFYFNSKLDFLTFAKKGQRISYSASFGISEIPEEKKANYKEWINGLDYISVREEAGADIVKDLTGREATVLVDPTLMLTNKEWRSIAKKPKLNLEQKFILTYFLGPASDETKKKIEDFAKEKNLKVINLLDKKNKFIYSVDPSEFVYLIDNCELMCTDSFHGCVFSIILNTPFVVFERKSKGKSMNSRIDTLLKLFSMQDRLAKNITSNSKAFEMNFDNVESVLEKERKRAKEFLKNAIK